MPVGLTGYRLFAAPARATAAGLTGGWRVVGAGDPPAATCVGTGPAAITIFLSRTAFIV